MGHLIGNFFVILILIVGCGDPVFRAFTLFVFKAVIKSKNKIKIKKTRS